MNKLMSKKKLDKAYKILASAFERKNLNNPSYSKNKLAKDLKVSGAFATQILSGKRQIPFERLKDLFIFLELDIFERQLVLKMMIKESAGNDVYENLILGDVSGLESRQSLGTIKTGLLTHWWNLAVLEGLGLASDKSDKIEIQNLQKKIGISAFQMEETLKLLLNLGLVKKTNETYKKIENHSYVPTGRSRSEVRGFHKQMLEKAMNELVLKTSDQDFHKRLITGFTFAMNLKNTEEAKIKILKFLDEFTREFSGEETTDIYQLSIQLFPLTKPTQI